MKNLVTLTLVPVLTMGAIGISAAQFGGESLGEHLGYGQQTEQKEHGSRRGQLENVSVDVQKLDNGIQMTQTSTNGDTIAKLHEKADKYLMMSQSTHTKVNIDKGIKMTITSDNADVVSLLQSKEQPTPKNDKITVSKTNIDNGVEITKTSDDTQIVRSLQEDKPMKGKHGKKNGKQRQHNVEDSVES